MLPDYGDESLLEYLATMLEDYSEDLDDDILGYVTTGERKAPERIPYVWCVV